MIDRTNIVGRFWTDERGGVSVDFIALTVSVALMGATYVVTHSNSSSDVNANISSEEVFVRKCAHVRAIGEDSGLTGLRSKSAC